MLFRSKMHLAMRASALVVFPGGFGTLDELTEMLTLIQTQKLMKKMVIVLYGSAFWKEIINFDALVKYEMISPEDLELFHFADSVDDAFRILQEGLTKFYLETRQRPEEKEEEIPAIAPSQVSTGELP